MTENPQEYEAERDQDSEPTTMAPGGASPQRQVEPNPAVDDADRSGRSDDTGFVG